MFVSQRLFVSTVFVVVVVVDVVLYSYTLSYLFFFSIQNRSIFVNGTCNYRYCSPTRTDRTECLFLLLAWVFFVCSGCCRYCCYCCRYSLLFGKGDCRLNVFRFFDSVVLFAFRNRICWEDACLFGTFTRITVSTSDFPSSRQVTVHTNIY